MISQRFKTKATLRILSFAFETVKSQTEEKQESIISGKPFSFSSFSNFWKFRKDFGIKNVFDKLRYFFVKMEFWVKCL